MTKKFDMLCTKILEDIDSVGSVFGNDGAYIVPDGPIPFVMGTFTRSEKKRKKRRKAKK